MTKYEHSKNQEKYEIAMNYLERNKKSFGILIDYQKVRIESQLNYKNVCGNKVENIWYTQILKELF